MGSTITVAEEDGGPMSRVLVHLEEGRAIELCAMIMALMRFLCISWHRRAGLPIVEAFKMGPQVSAPIEQIEKGWSAALLPRLQIQAYSSLEESASSGSVAGMGPQLLGWVGSKLTVTVLQWLKWTRIVEVQVGILGRDPGVSLRARGHLLGSNAADTRLSRRRVLFHASSSEWDELHLEVSDLHVGSAGQCQAVSGSVKNMRILTGQHLAQQRLKFE